MTNEQTENGIENAVEIPDEELENVSGGCGDPKISDKGSTYWKCPRCERSYYWNGKWKKSAAPNCDVCKTRMKFDHYAE